MRVVYRRIQVPVLLVVIIALMLMMSDINKLVAEYVAKSGATSAISDVIGIGALANQSAWLEWSTVPELASTRLGPPDRLIMLDTFLDLIFIASYLLLGLVAWGRLRERLPIRSEVSAAEVAAPSDEQRHDVARARERAGRRRVLTGFLVLLCVVAGVDVLEDVLLLIGSALLGDRQGDSLLTGGIGGGR